VRRLEQGLTLFTAILWLIGIVVVIQLWLVSAALDALLGGDRHVLLPAALASLVLFLLNGSLLLFVLRFDRRVRGALQREEAEWRPRIGG
jgi:F0F1-type ATP synthase assembly protein I